MGHGATVLAPRRRWLVPAGLAGAAAVALTACTFAWRAEHARLGEWGFPLDDSWIHCQIARNVADGHGWSFNPGVPVQNSSGPLWTALLAVGFVVFGTSVWVPKILGVLCFLACIVLVWRLAQLWTGERSTAVAAALLTATSVPLAWHGLSGMETALAAVLVLGTLAAFQTWRRGAKRYLWTVLAALAVMTRPETLVIVPLLLAEGWWWARQADGPGAERDAARLVGIGTGIIALVLLPYFVLNLQLSGSLFPTTFAAKAGATGLANALRHGDVLEILLAFTLYPYAWSVHAVSFWGFTNAALWLVMPLGAWAVARGPRPTLAAAFLLAMLPALRGMAAPHVLPTIHEGRYIGVLLPLFYICAASGLLTLVRSATALPFRATATRLVAAAALLLVVLAWVRLELRVPQVGAPFWHGIGVLWGGARVTRVLDIALTAERMGLFLAVAATCLVLLLGLVSPRARRLLGMGLAAAALFVQAQRLPRLPSHYAGNVRDIHDMDVTLGRWVRQNVPPDVSVAVNDIGAIAFFGERRIVDAIGLATPELTPYWSPRRLRSLIALQRLRPELCIIFPTWFPEWVVRPSLLEPLLRHYVEDSVILGGAEAVVFRMHWDLFTRYYDTNLLERLDPAEAYDSFQGHLRRGLRNLQLPTRAFLYARAGEFERQRHDDVQAVQNFQRAVQLDPHELGAWKGLLEMARQAGNEERVGVLLATMVQQLPNSSAAFEARGDWQARSGDLEGAEQSYDEALALHPDNTRLLGKMEKFWTARGRAELAAALRARRLEVDWPPPRALTLRQP